jgi:signal transduction histidine kinase
VPRLYAFQLVRAAGGGIIVCTGVSREAALAEVRAEVSRTFAAVLTVGLALILIAWFGAGLFIARPMGRLVVAAQRLANGDLSARTDAGRGPREIARLANAFNRMAAALQHEAAEREKLLARVVENDRQLRSLAAEAALSEERERHAIATGLHDKAGPLLATCYMKLGRLLRDPLPEEAAAAIGDCRTLIDHAIQEVRTLTFDLSSPALYTLGLPAALQQLCADMAESHEMDILFQDEGVPADLAEDRGVVLYRAARELLFNVAKHAAARRVELACGQKDGMIFVRVADDGVGFDATDAGRGFSRSGGFGLFKLRERLAHMGGRLTVDSARGAGARIVVALPPRETDGRGGDGHDHPDSAG